MMPQLGTILDDHSRYHGSAGPTPSQWVPVPVIRGADRAMVAKTWHSQDGDPLTSHCISAFGFGVACYFADPPEPECAARCGG